MAITAPDGKANITLLDKATYVQIDNAIKLLQFRKVIRNWPIAILFRLGVVHNPEFKLRDGSSVIIRDIAQYRRFWETPRVRTLFNKWNGIDLKAKIGKNTVSFPWKGKTVKFYYDSERELGNVLVVISAFLTSRHSWLRSRDRDMVDIGGAVADTAIYFALSGVRHVYSFEPYPHAYGLAMKNIALNHLSKKITFLKEGVGEEMSSITIDPNYQSGAVDDLKEFKKGEKVPIVTLENITNRFRLKDAVLKVNCEGGEYPIILGSSDKTLRKFSQMVVDYHYGYLNLVERIEKAGFRVTHTNPTYLYAMDARNKHMYGGTIYAERV